MKPVSGVIVVGKVKGLRDKVCEIKSRSASWTLTSPRMMTQFGGEERMTKDNSAINVSP